VDGTTSGSCPVVGSGVRYYTAG